MVEFFKMKIENLKKSIPPSVPASNRKKEQEKVQEKKKGFCQYHGIHGHTMEQCTTLKALVRQAK